MSASLHHMSTYNTNKRQDGSKDRMQDKPEHKVKEEHKDRERQERE